MRKTRKGGSAHRWRCESKRLSLVSAALPPVSVGVWSYCNGVDKDVAVRLLVILANKSRKR
jgi:hypothetical protein